MNNILVIFWLVAQFLFGAELVSGGELVQTISRSTIGVLLALTVVAMTAIMKVR